MTDNYSARRKYPVYIPIGQKLVVDEEREVVFTGGTMKGIQFLVDEVGEKKAVLIDLKTHGEVWEDIYDVLLARKRADEPRESIEKVRKRLIQRGRLGKSS